MTTQPEAILESELIQQLVDNNYESVTIPDETALLSNLKTQIEAHNGLLLTEKEYSRVLNHLNKGNVFERAKILRDKMQLTKDDSTSVYLDFINQDSLIQVLMKRVVVSRFWMYLINMQNALMHLNR